MPTVSKYAMRSPAEGVCLLRGLITEADLPLAEKEWPGLRDFLLAHSRQRAPLDLPGPDLALRRLQAAAYAGRLI